MRLLERVGATVWKRVRPSVRTKRQSIPRGLYDEVEAQGHCAHAEREDDDWLRLDWSAVGA